MREYLYNKPIKEKNYNLVKAVPLIIKKEYNGLLARVKDTNVLAFGENIEETADSLMTMCVKLLRIYHNSNIKVLEERDLKKKKILEGYFEKVE